MIREITIHREQFCFTWLWDRPDELRIGFLLDGLEYRWWHRVPVAELSRGDIDWPRWLAEHFASRDTIKKINEGRDTNMDMWLRNTAVEASFILDDFMKLVPVLLPGVSLAKRRVTAGA